MPKYKKSKFNYVSSRPSGYLIYNTLYSSLSRLDDREFALYEQNVFESKDFCKELLSQGIIVDSSVDELERYNIYTGLSFKYMNGVPNITVTPTMECNARCFYCYENGVRHGKMTAESAKKIVAFIKTLDVSKGVNITWFGGEPLMNQGWIDYFTEYLKAENISFSSFIITNGSMIDDVVISKMKNDWNVDSVQITIDGASEEYCRRKNYVDQDENVYYRLLKKIKKVSTEGIRVQLRLNIDRRNAESIISVAEELQQVFFSDSNVHFYPAFLTGDKIPLSEDEKVEIVRRIVEIDKNMLPMRSYLYKIPRVSACFYNQKNAFSIDSNGRIYNCERALGRLEKSIGAIENGVNENNNVRVLSGSRAECQKCVFLPRCQGGCNDAIESAESPCFIDKYIIMAYLKML